MGFNGFLSRTLQQLVSFLESKDRGLNGAMFACFVQLNWSKKCLLTQRTLEEPFESAQLFTEFPDICLDTKVKSRTLKSFTTWGSLFREGSK